MGPKKTGSNRYGDWVPQGTFRLNPYTGAMRYQRTPRPEVLRRLRQASARGAEARRGTKRKLTTAELFKKNQEVYHRMNGHKLNFRNKNLEIVGLRSWNDPRIHPQILKASVFGNVTFKAWMCAWCLASSYSHENARIWIRQNTPAQSHSTVFELYKIASKYRDHIKARRKPTTFFYNGRKY